MVGVVGCRLFLFGEREYISVTQFGLVRTKSVASRRGWDFWSVCGLIKRITSDLLISASNYKCNTYMRESTMSFIGICFGWDNEE